MKHVFDVIKKPLFTEKGMDMKESENKILIQVNADANKHEIKQAMEEIFKSEGRQGECRQYQGKEAPLWQVHRPAFRQEKGDCNPETG